MHDRLRAVAVVTAWQRVFLPQSPLVLSMKQFLMLCVLPCAVFFLLAACRGSSTSSGSYLSPEQTAQVLAEAQRGDLPAIKRLISHYEASGDVDGLAGPWRVRARKLGDPSELYHHAAWCFTASQEEQDPKVRAQLLEDALASAKRASAVDPSAQLLADQIAHVQMQATRAE